MPLTAAYKEKAKIFLKLLKKLALMRKRNSKNFPYANATANTCLIYFQNFIDCSILQSQCFYYIVDSDIIDSDKWELEAKI